MNSASLNPLQMIGVSLVGHRHDRQQLRLGAGLETEVVRPAEVEHFLDDLPLLVHLDRIDAEVPAVVLVLRDGRLKGAVDVGEPLAQDVAEPDQDRQADAAKLQVIDQLLEIDRALGVLCRVNAEVTVRSDREIAFPPPLDLVQFRCVVHCPRIALTPGALHPTCATHAANNIGKARGCPDEKSRRRWCRTPRGVRVVTGSLHPARLRRVELDARLRIRLVLTRFAAGDPVASARPTASIVDTTPPPYVS